ncbi:HD-GYP domain-containing protein [Paenibacillus sp.]|uniref:HD-GYP domain-containing protein n=1 Tax=Paenibacillus sp. TaxID=58172 RepID=UPI002D5DF22D|nr:HD-GYP domain-containing protein [Paenibacillus sp.]HZG55914.1 HD-GYP domain-containing protein [Paenibacillus sp.]
MEEREDQAPLKACMKEPQFCPVSLPKRASWFWIAFAAASAAAAAINVLRPDPALLALFAIPAIYIGLVRVPAAGFALANAALCALIAAVSGWETESAIPAAAFLAIACLARRVSAVSQRHFARHRQYEELFMDTMLSFAKSIDTRDPYTAFHSRNVASYARSIAAELKLPGEQTEAIYLAGLIHDIGKIGTPEHILGKESRLTEEEYEIMKQHPEAGYEIVKNIARLQELGITDMVRHHHERVDGRGYPLGLKGDAIPLGARILAAADAFDAMTTNRSYRQKLATETAAEELRRHSGTQFDKDVADAFLRVLTRSGKLAAERGERPGVTAPSAV